MSEILANLNIHPAMVFLITMAFSVFLFAAVRILMNLLYRKILFRWRRFSDIIKRIERKGSPMLKKYGILGLVLFVALPLPGTGVVGGTILSWLIGSRWYVSFLTIIPASALPNILATASVVGLISGLT